MPAHAEAPKEPRRRVRRPPRKAGNSSVIDAPMPDGQEASALLDCAGDTIKSTQILRREESDPPPTFDGTLMANLSRSTITPRPRTKAEGDQAKRQTGNESAPEPVQRRTKKTKTPQAKHVKSPPTSTQSNMASTSSRPDISTSRSSNATPSKAYAGPTFHASPAASSLPLPKFFSKSVPNADKTTSLKRMLEQDSLESTSDSEDSPLQDMASPSQGRQGREESPLDIFFQADKDAKAKGSLGIPNGQIINEKQTLLDKLEISDGSPAGPRKRNHVRHHTDSSAAGVFPLEMDVATQKSSLQHQITMTSSHTSLSGEGLPYAARIPTKQERKEGLRQAQSLALKQLLHSPLPQRFIPSPIGSEHQAADAASPSDKARPRNQSSARPSGTPPQFPNGLENLPEQRRAVLLALAEKQIAPMNGHTAERSPASGLRKETVIPTSNDHKGMPDMPDMPSIPTPHFQNKKAQSNIARSYSTPDNDVAPIYRSFPIGNGMQIFSNVVNDDNSASARLMENDLRRILKLGAFGSDGVAGIRS
ncbi:MAG: hypothetical protein Q9217_004110 [Psora testacea]